MELFGNLGVSSIVLPQLLWDGTAAVGGQFLRKCVLGGREFCANVPGRVSSQEKPKPQLAQCLLSNKDDFFLLFYEFKPSGTRWECWVLCGNGLFRLDLLV